MEEVAADGDMPGYRYERFTRKAPVRSRPFRRHLIIYVFDDDASVGSV